MPNIRLLFIRVFPRVAGSAVGGTRGRTARYASGSHEMLQSNRLRRQTSPTAAIALTVDTDAADFSDASGLSGAEAIRLSSDPR